MSCDYCAVIQEPLSLKEHNLLYNQTVIPVRTLKDAHCEYQSDLSHVIYLTFKRTCVKHPKSEEKARSAVDVLQFS